MAPIFVVDILTVRNKASRDLVIENLDAFQSHVLAHEPSVLKHCATVPRDPHDTRSLYILCEFSSRAALDEHTSSPAIISLRRWFEANPGLLTDPPLTLTFEPFCGFTWTKAGDPARRNPFITLTTLTYESAEVARKAEYTWSNVSRRTERRRDKALLGYQVMRQDDEQNILRSLEVFESETDREKHEGQDSTRRIEKVDSRNGRKWKTVLELRVVGGFLRREGRVRSVL